MKKFYCRFFQWVCLLLAGHTAFGQGSLTPSGPPAPTMKSLDQVQPRIAITSLPVTINQPGSYYLTQSFAQAFSQDAITIFTNNVTIDFYGFTLQQTSNAVSIVGIRINAPTTIPLSNVVIKNGSITGFAATGITCLGPRNCTFENLTVSECGGGITMQNFGSVGAVGNIVRRCHFCDNSSSGVTLLSGSANVLNVFENCDAVNNTSAGFALAAAGNFIQGCRASGNGNNYVIAAGNRGGLVVLPGTNVVAISSNSGGQGLGAGDPDLNVSY